MKPVADVVIAVVVVLFLVALLAKTWTAGGLAARDRFALVSAVVDAVVLLAVARAIVMPQGLASWLWVAGCGLIGVGIAGAVLRWPQTPWDASQRPGRDARPRRRIMQSAFYLLGGAAIVALVM
ncbi:hypothetical protein [Hoyosella altamirensis]|uniref:Uncharacterized protein n=1 Tax=Hoyosella altamirensis TaxID=616997 RepID=A0A839RQ54_9ACTN|nr:hypothetical protein [Hoyosella altamirensis]MBB3038176.1 hypothetical protein [Hoyosella altamirensis]